ncbi:shikimate dehydrogenase family protein [Phaeodactylibacter xiamenensis]|jgi:shikimate dehydrogenase|uniref:shikimate dehydrogenase family protein n=1 Tax=Phaeodactylibacter xiamenensis TaxID=1524460 RepID=UPI0024A983C7|nr:shikimate dehydrogenase [Phaeodactylibacter xiamenensis]
MKPLNEYERLFGLIGYPLSHSFSKQYFSEKFAKADITDACYELFPIRKIEALPELLQEHPNLVGLNVTIPYKQAVLPYLDKLSEGAAAVGAVNTIRRSGDQLEGFNTDVVGFETSLCSWLEATRGSWSNLRALVLGTGGAAKAVAFVLGRLEIPFKMVSRTPGNHRLSYEQVTPEMIAAHELLINTTPLGMSPHTAGKPELPYHALGSSHYLYDLVYNPASTAFMELGLKQGAKAMNGLQMLHGQAEAAWAIWTERDIKK